MPPLCGLCLLLLLFSADQSPYKVVRIELSWPGFLNNGLNPTPFFARMGSLLESGVGSNLMG